RRERASREHEVAEARRESLHLRLDRFRHVLRRPVRDVAVRPRRVLPGRGAGRVEERVLGEEHERPRARPATPGVPLGGRDLVERPAEMDGARGRALGRAPGDRAVESPVELERTGAVSVRTERALVARRQPAAREPDELPRDDVREDEVGARQLVLRARRMDLAAQGDQAVDERVGDPLRAAARERPAACVVACRSRSISAALPSSYGWATAAGGSTQSMGSSSRRKNGDPLPIGWIAEQTSWTKPGRVSSSLRVPPPSAACASCTVTAYPASASVIPAASPFGPEPITTARRARERLLPPGASGPSPPL